MKKVIKILAIIVGSVVVFFLITEVALSTYVYYHDNSYYPQNTEYVPFSEKEYSNEFNRFEENQNQVFRWNFGPPDFRLKGKSGLYGYYNDPENIYIFDTSMYTLYYRGNDGYPEISNDLVEKIVLARWNNTDIVYGADFRDGETLDWLTGSEQIKNLLQFVSSSKTAELKPIEDAAIGAYIRVIYADSPIQEIVGRLIVTSDNKYYFQPYSRSCWWDNLGIPYNASAYGGLPADCDWPDSIQ